MVLGVHKCTDSTNFTGKLRKLRIGVSQSVRYGTNFSRSDAFGSMQ